MSANRLPVRNARRGLLVVMAVMAALLAPGAVAGAQETAVPTLGAVLDGEVAGLSATATTAFAGEDPSRPAMEVEIQLTNPGDTSVPVAVPFGMLLATDDEADQTTGVLGPTDDPTLAEVAASGGTPEITAAPGTTYVMLTVYCAELDDGAPYEPTPMHYAGMAAEPLPAVLRNIAAQQPDDWVGQEAVWWVTDDPTYPPPADIAPLLEGVDAEAFASDPHQVVPDSAYAPGWSRAGVVDEAFDGGTQSRAPAIPGSSSGSWLFWLLAAGAVLGTIAIVAAARRGGRRPDAARVIVPPRPGWYPDPGGSSSYRFWDGARWR
ncbi:MAG: DUF2510 domain-containing protein [Acidimicrobiales bacterium]|nr:DUF2510 domain-containing protein [Acidimicrobiales bacterium]